jgi:CheY-like chemotaxis protein
MDIEAFLISSTVVCVVAQRLLRKLCTACKRPADQSPDAASELFQEITGAPVGSLASGCVECGYSGYSGRLPIAEIIEIGDELRGALTSGHTDLDTLRQAASGRGRSMSSVTADWIVSGVTTPEEATRALGGRFWRELCLAHDHAFASLPPLATTSRARDTDLPDILTIAPDAQEAEKLRSTLNAIGLQLSVANTIDEAIAKLQQESSIRMLLLDVDQSDIETRPLLRKLRASFTWAGLPFLLLLRENDKETEDLLETYGVSDYLFKPFDDAQLIQRIKGVLSR